MYRHCVNCVFIPWFLSQILLCVEMFRATCGSFSLQTLIHGAAGNLYVVPTHMQKQMSENAVN